MGSVIPIRSILPRESHGEMHVWRSGGDEWVCAHESASGGSWSGVYRFATREEAVAGALALLPVYAPCKLGRIGE